MIHNVNAIIPTHTSHFHCIAKLVQRRLLTFYRDRTDFYITYIQAPVLVLAFFLVFQEIITINGTSLFTPLRNYLTSDTVGLIIFLAVLTAVWFGTSKAIIEIPSSKILYRQEKLSFLKNSDYIISIFIALSIIVLGQVILFVFSFHLLFVVLPAWMNPFETGLVLTKDESVSFFNVLMPLFLLKFIALMWLTAMASIAVAMLISVFIPTRSAANAILPFVLIIQILMGGSVIKPVTSMNAVIGTIASTMVSRWAFEAATLLFEQELNFSMPRYTTEHSRQSDFVKISFSGTGPLSLKNRDSRKYIECLKESWRQQRAGEKITCDQYQDISIQSNAPMVVTRHPEILREWYQALMYALEESDNAVLTAEKKNKSKELQALYKKLQNSVVSDVPNPTLLKNMNIPEWILDQATENFYGDDEGLYKKRADKVLNLSKYEQIEIDTLIMEHAIRIDPNLKLFRAQNTQKTWLILCLMLGFSLLLTWLFFRQVSKSKKTFF